ncbi:hypothetical protein LguiA_008293 [Lonicera macranthoides]
MNFRTGVRAVDLWTELLATEEEEEDNNNQPQKGGEAQIAVVCRRKRADNVDKDAVIVPPKQQKSNSTNENRLSLAPIKRVSWKPVFSLRCLLNVAVDLSGGQERDKLRIVEEDIVGKFVQPPNFDKERAYFEEVDSFELLEESPSPKKSTTWVMGIQSEKIVVSHLSSVLEKWLITRKQNRGCGPSISLSKILETPALHNEYDDDLQTPEKVPLQFTSGLHSIQNRFNSTFIQRGVFERQISSRKSNEEQGNTGEVGCEDIEVAVRKLSLASRPSSLDDHQWDSFLTLLTVCGLSAPSTLLDVFSSYCDPKHIVKVGEGTYGEAFKAGETVCKIVPFNGNLRVNGEVQKRSEELLEEVILSLTLNRLRGHEEHEYNACTTFIETVNLSICQGPYDAALVNAWEEWDSKHGSENDHPKEFPENQCYVVFVQEHGGRDLESFVLLNFDEARSLLVQVTLALAVAEAAYEFEHRDLHWGNILLSRKDSAALDFTLEGRKICVKTFGLVISIIDFTLSRINTGEDILFLDLSLDPELFEGPKGDKQAETYRKMKEVTEECWEGSFPKTNVLWLQYLVDILLLKKSFDRTSKNERDLRSLKKRLNSYNSAKEATLDPFFIDLFLNV